MSDPDAARIPAPREPPPGEAILGALDGPDETTAPTRRLCTLLYVEEDLRAEVKKHFPARGSRAWAPCYAVDLIAVLRHARRAGALMFARDAALCLLLVALVASASLLCFATPLAGLATMLTVSVSIAGARVVMVRREVSAWSLARRFFGYAKSPQPAGVRARSCARTVGALHRCRAPAQPMGHALGRRQPSPQR